MAFEVVSREVFVPSPGAGVGVLAGSYYTTVDGARLVSVHKHMSRSDTCDVAYLRTSEDNGRSWSGAQAWPTRFDHPEGTGRRHPRGGYVDPVTGRYVTVWTEGVLPTDSPLEGMRRWVLHYSVSCDGGATQVVNEQVICEDDGCDARHPLPDVTTGCNCVMIGDLGQRPITRPDGVILVPVQSSPTGPDGDYANPGAGLTYTDAMVLMGRWREDGGLAWTCSERIEGDPERTTRGMVEPTLGRLNGDRLLVVMRGSNDRRPELPAHKWFAISDDGGMTWSRPEPWTWDEGAAFFSPSSCSQLVEHSDGRLFWMGNICPDNARGNSPRYPIVLGEVDRDSGLLVRDSISIVDDRRPGESEHLTLSNFLVREDRETGQLLLHLSRLFAHDDRHSGKPDFTADAMLVRIDL